MESGSDFVFPGILDALALGDPAALHQGGLDDPSIRLDPPDSFGNDTELSPDDARQWRNEQLPQFGPPFVRAVMSRFDALENISDKLLSRWTYEPQTVVIFGSMQTDANGNVNRSVSPNAMLYEPPPGFTLALHRIYLGAGGSNFGTPFNAAAAYWELRVNDEAVDGSSLVAASGGALPMVKSWGTRDAPRCRDGEVMSLFVSGTAALANKTITVRGQGTLERHPES